MRTAVYDDLTEADLDAWLAGEAEHLDDDWQPPDDPPLVDEERANRLLAGRRIALREVDRVERIAQARITDTRAWAADRAAGPLRKVAWIDRALEGWFRQIAGSRRSLKMPDGTVKLTKPRGRIVTDDTDALISWAADRARPDLFRVRYEPDAAALHQLHAVEVTDCAECSAAGLRHYDLCLWRCRRCDSPVDDPEAPGDCPIDEGAIHEPILDRAPGVHLSVARDDHFKAVSPGEGT